jgi:hypothetical protein
MRTLKHITTGLFLLVSVSITAQQGINYKAIVKDGNGNVVANDIIIIQFQILQGTGMTNEYQETHTPTTDANGVVILNIGEGAVNSGDYNTIDWGADDHFLNVQINTGGGLTDMGTTQFMAVPYALSAANAQGLMMLDQGNGFGWRIPNRGFADQYGPIGLNAVDLNFCTDGAIPRGAMGDYSIAMGNHTIATGDYSTTMGSISSAYGKVATAMGTTAAVGDYSTSMGKSVVAFSYGETAMGVNGTSYTPATDGDIMWNPTDRLFSIGNGVSGSTTSNALTILKNGNTGIGTSDPTNTFSVLQPTNTGNTVRFESQSHTSGKDLLELVIPSDASPTSQFIEMQKGILTVARINGDGSADFTSKLHVEGGTDANLNIASGFLVLGSENGVNIVMDNNEIMARNNYGTSTLVLQNQGGAVSVGGSVVHSSDRRLKKDITELPYGLKEVLKLQPKSYYWKNREQKQKSLGLIAQEVQPIINEIVTAQDDEEKTLGVSYTELIPVLIKAIQEQQEIIESQDNEIKTLTAKQKTTDERLNKMEALLNN